MAELGFVGDGPNSYQLWLGGTPHQTRLAAAFQDRVKLQVRPGEGACDATTQRVSKDKRLLLGCGLSGLIQARGCVSVAAP